MSLDDTQAPVTPGIDSPGPQLVPERVETSSAERPEEGRAPTGPSQAGVRAASASPLARRARVEPLASGRYRVEFTASAQLHDKLTRLQALMRSSVPGGDLAVIIEEAVTEKLERLEARRFGKTKAPRKDLDQTDTTPTSRHIPAAVRRVVHERDGGRCKARDRLEFHHRKPFGRGGDHSPENIAILCAVHNALVAERDYGKEVMARHRGSGGRVSEPRGVYSIGKRVAGARQRPRREGSRLSGGPASQGAASSNSLPRRPMFRNFW